MIFRRKQWVCFEFSMNGSPVVLYVQLRMGLITTAKSQLFEIGFVTFEESFSLVIDSSHFEKQESGFSETARIERSGGLFTMIGCNARLLWSTNCDNLVRL